jgi:predicted nucleic acid binding AN1-type Zn finger protein
MINIFSENKTVTSVINKISNEAIEEKLDDTLNKVKKSDDTCDFKGCKQKTNLMGQNCEHCKMRYCYKHILAEIHGSGFTNCAELIKKKERDEFLHPKIDTRKVAQQVEHGKAKKSLEGKLKQMQLERKAKPSSSGKKKK